MIQEGLLWFDDTPTRPTADKIAHAVARYRQKYGRSPDVCYVNPACLAPSDTSDGAAVQVVAAKSVLPNHFWLGVHETPAQAEARAKKQRRSKIEP